jgi:glycosyltransferase involved in cell wall biosynthesis
VVYRLNETGGAERSTVLLLAALAERGIRLRVLTLGGDADFPSRSLLEAAGVEIVAISGGLLARTRAVVRDVRRTRPALVHTALFEPDQVGRLAAALAGVPAMVTLTNTQYSAEAFAQARSPRRLEAVRRLDAAFGRHLTTTFHAVSAAAGREAERTLGARPEQVALVYRGRDLDAFAAQPAAGAAVRAELGIAPDVPVLLNIARQEPQKGQELLLDAFADVHAKRPDAVLLIAGREGTATPVLEERIARHGLAAAVRFLGVRTDIPAVLAAADVTVTSSRWEGVAGAVLEAMVAEVPVAGFGIEPVREVTAGHAALVLLGDTEALGRELLALLDDPDRRRALAAEAHGHAVATFSLEGYGDAMAELYRTVIDDPARYPRPALTRAMAKLRRSPTDASR